MTDHDPPVGMPPHKYGQAKDRARDDLTRRELVNMVYDLSAVAYVDVDGEDDD